MWDRYDSALNRATDVFARPEGNDLCMVTGLPLVPAYIDPTGGLPPPALWMAIAAVLGCFGVAFAFLRVLGRRTLSFLKRSWQVPAVLIAFAAGGLVVWWTTGRAGSPGAGEVPRVVILGMDGLDPDLLREYMHRGELPNFSRLAEKGLFHELRTTIPPQSPVAWASFITGRGRKVTAFSTSSDAIRRPTGPTWP